MDAQPRSQVGPYRLLRVLGTGGLAQIHLAARSGPAEFEKQMAVKILHDHLRGNPGIVDLFLREARITASLNHPNIVQVFALEQTDDCLYMVMEYVDGVDLRHLLSRLEERRQVAPSDLALAITIEVAKALRYAHAALPSGPTDRAPVIHRDLSPGNVMLSRDGVVKLLDFGVAKTLLGDEETDRIARGKWPYMSPEQVRGEALDGRSDLFSLGAVFYELLTGRQAFGGRTVVDSMRRVERADVPPAPGVEPVLEEVLNKLLARERDDRYADADEAVNAMAQVLMLRGKTTGERELAALVAGLAEDAPTADRPATTSRGSTPEPASEEETTGGSFGAGDLTGQLTIPTHRPGEISPSLGVRVRQAASAGEPASTDIYGPDQVTLPPDAGEITSAETPSTRAMAEADAEQETTAARPHEARAKPIRAVHPSAHTLGSRPQAAAGVVGHEAARGAGASPGPADEVPIGGSEPRVYFDHFMPSEVLEEQEAPARVWTTRNLLVLGLAILAILIAGLAILIAVRQQMDRQQGPGSGAVASRAERDAAVADASRPTADARTARPIPQPRRTDASARRPRTTPRDAAVPPPRPDAASTPPPVPAGRKPVGLPRRGQLDVITRPAGAKLIVDGQLRGKTPLRLAVKPGGRVRLAVSLRGRRLYKSPVWIPMVTGRRLVLLLPRIVRFRPAEAGHTAIRVRCRTQGMNRVYIDGQDTGYDCPTPPLSVLPTVHTVSMYVPAQHRIVWKKLRPKVRQIAEVTWPY